MLLTRLVCPIAILCVSVMVLWPALLTSGMLAQRDLLVMPRISVPRSLLWMGPDLGRRLPTFAGLAFLSSLIGGLTTGRIMLIASITAVGLGMSRLVIAATRDDPRREESGLGKVEWATTVLATGAGCTLMVMPFTLTRLSVGHLTTLWAIAATPFLLVAASRSNADVARSRAVAVAALLGMVAGIYSLVIVLAATPLQWRPMSLRGPARLLAAWLSRHAVWILPGAFLQLHGYATFADPDAFRPRLEGPTQVLGLVLGRGYWDEGAEVVRGNDGLVALGALILISFAAAGWTRLAPRFRPSVVAGLAVGYLAPLAASAPLSRDLVRMLVATPLGAPLREPHRLVGLGLVPLLLLASLGVIEVATWARTTAGRGSISAVIVIAISIVPVCCLKAGLPTVHRRIDPIPIPAAWTRAATIVDETGGMVLALPWKEYVLLDLDRPRPVYHPVADLFGPDTLASSDPAMGVAVNEAADPRAATAAVAAAQLVGGRFPAAELASLRVRWVAVLKVEEASSLDLTGLKALRREVSSPSLDLYQVVAAPDPAGRTRLPFVIGRSGVTDVPWTWGWYVPGVGIANRTAAGLLAVEGPAVFLPAFAGLGFLSWTLLCASLSLVRKKSLVKGRSARDTEGIRRKLRQR